MSLFLSIFVFVVIYGACTGLVYSMCKDITKDDNLTRCPIVYRLAILLSPITMCLLVLFIVFGLAFIFIRFIVTGQGLKKTE